MVIDAGGNKELAIEQKRKKSMVDKEKREEQEREERERIEKEQHLKRVRELIEEDKKGREREALRKEQETMQFISSIHTSLIPLVSDKQASAQIDMPIDKITVKIVYNAVSFILTLDKSMPVVEFASLIKKRLGLKKIKVYSVSKKNLSLESKTETIEQAGIQNMEVLHLEKI